MYKANIFYKHAVLLKTRITFILRLECRSPIWFRLFIEAIASKEKYTYQGDIVFFVLFSVSFFHRIFKKRRIVRI